MRYRDRRAQAGRLVRTVLGLAFAAGAVMAVYVFVTTVANFNDPDQEFPFGLNRPGASMAAIKVSALVLFALFFVVAVAVANSLLDHPLRRLRHWWRERATERS